MSGVFRSAGLAFLAIAFLGLLASLGIPMIGGGNPALFSFALLFVGFGLGLLLIYTVVFTAKNGFAASGITLPGMFVFAASSIVAWWFLFGPRANSFPRYYGLGTLVIALIIASQILPRVYKLKREVPRFSESDSPFNDSK